MCWWYEIYVWKGKQIVTTYIIAQHIFQTEADTPANQGFSTYVPAKVIEENIKLLLAYPWFLISTR